VIRSYKAHQNACLNGTPITEVKGKNAAIALSDYRQIVKEMKGDW
jgi:chromosome partitioning protein